MAPRVAAAFDALGIDHAIGGRLASSLQGEPRSTNDVDFALRLEEHHVSPLIDRLGPNFVVDAEGLRAAVRQRQFAPLGDRARRAGPAVGGVPAGLRTRQATECA